MLKEKIDISFSQIPRSKWHLFHKKTVENFVYHLPKIKGVSEKKQIEENLVLYLEKIELNSKEELNTLESIELFNTYLYPLAKKFEWRLGFVAISSLKGLLFVIPFLFLVLYFLYTLNANLFVIFLSLSFLYFLIAIIKLFKKKVYGIGY